MLAPLRFQVGGALQRQKNDLIPDFLIFNDRRTGGDGTNDALCAGFFDSYWRLSPDLTWFFDEKKP